VLGGGGAEARVRPGVEKLDLSLLPQMPIVVLRIEVGDIVGV
jgi:hypothetical protein